MPFSALNMLLLRFSKMVVFGKSPRASLQLDLFASVLAAKDKFISLQNLSYCGRVPSMVFIAPIVDLVTFIKFSRRSLGLLLN